MGNKAFHNALFWLLSFQNEDNMCLCINWIQSNKFRKYWLVWLIVYCMLFPLKYYIFPCKNNIGPLLLTITGLLSLMTVPISLMFCFFPYFSRDRHFLLAMLFVDILGYTLSSDAVYCIIQSPCLSQFGCGVSCHQPFIFFDWMDAYKEEGKWVSYH